MCWGVFLKHLFLNSSWMFAAYILKEGWRNAMSFLETTSPSLPNLHRQLRVFFLVEGLHLGECCCFFGKKKWDSRITEIFEKSIFATKKKPEIMYFP